MNLSVYLLDFGDVVKVGHSNNVKQRIKDLSRQFSLGTAGCNL